MVERIIYLDHNATTPLHPGVKRAVAEAMDVYGNASSFHAPGREARRWIEEARLSLARAISADSDEIIFLGSGSEANNTVLNIFMCNSPACRHRTLSGKGIVTSVIEHPCIVETSRCLKERGCSVHTVGVDGNGTVDAGELERILSNEKIGLVSIMLANNEVGTIQDVAALSDLAHRYGAFMHTDAVQGLGKIPVDVRKLGVDFLSLSGHKVYGPKGVGALYVKKGTPFCPFIRGGHQEKGRRAGTENTLGIVGFGKAVTLATGEMASESARLDRLKRKLRSGIERTVPDVHFNGHPRHCLPNTLNVSFEGAEGESILLYLDLEGICVSTGSACSSGNLDPSHVLLAMGVDAERAHGSIRFSMGRDTREEDIDFVLEKLPSVIGRIRKMSTAYNPRRNA
jgi:cysteine desulfurase